MLKKVEAKEIDALLFVNSLSGQVQPGVIKLIREYKPEFEVIVNNILQDNSHLTTIREKTWFPHVFRNVEQALEFADVENKEQILAYLFMIYINEYNVKGHYPSTIIKKFMKKFNIARPKPPAKPKKKITYKYNYVLIESMKHVSMTQAIKDIKTISQKLEKQQIVSKMVKVECSIRRHLWNHKKAGEEINRVFRVHIIVKIKKGDSWNFKFPKNFSVRREEDTMTNLPVITSNFILCDDLSLVIEMIKKMRYTQTKSTHSYQISSPSRSRYSNKKYKSVEDFMEFMKNKHNFPSDLIY